MERDRLRTQQSIAVGPVNHCARFGLKAALANVFLILALIYLPAATLTAAEAPYPMWKSVHPQLSIA